MPEVQPKESLSDLARERVYETQVKGVAILELNFGDITADAALAMLEHYRRSFLGRTEGSVRVLSNVSGAHYDAAISNKWKAVRREVDPYIRASAVYGVDGILGVVVRSFAELLDWFRLPGAKDKIRIFRTREEAVDWLLKR